MGTTTLVFWSKYRKGSPDLISKKDNDVPHTKALVTQIKSKIISPEGFQGSSVIRNPPSNPGAVGDVGSIPGLGRFHWRRKWQPSPVFLLG